VLGPGTGDTLVLAAKRRGAVSRAAGWIAPVVVAGGRVAGTWAADASALRVELFDGSGPVPDDGLRGEAARVAAHLGRDLHLVVTRG
jgi:hypothetical protein